jgi:TatD DNase family protein
VRLVDSHCHLQADRFEADVDQVIGAARMAGVERILVPGWNPESCHGALELVDRYPSLDAAVGVHPHDADKVDETAWAEVAALAVDKRVVATGETGLDFDRLFSPVPAQLANLRRNLRLAADTGKRAILHCRSVAGRRDAQDALLDEILAFGSTPPPVLIHSFSGPVDYAEAMLDLGAIISISGLAFRTGEEATTEVVRRAPGDRLLVETDSPYLSPPGAPRGRNEPEWVRVTAAWMAELRGEDRDAFGDQLVENYDAAFRSERIGALDRPH